jgi:hypothetical protein
MSSPCAHQVPAHGRACVICGRDAGFPNVRAAAVEAPQLDARFRSALSEADARGCRQVTDAFSSSVLTSKAVICRDAQAVNALVSSDDALYASFYNKVVGQSVLPAKNDFDPRRSGIDGTFFPFYHEEIRFGALSLNGTGTGSYGGYAIVIKDDAISARTSVFEENTLVFARKHRVPAGGPIPSGYRATWEERNKLAVAKLHTRLSKATDPQAFSGILLNVGGGTDRDDFIEVHIYGPLHRRAIEVVAGPRTNEPGELALQQNIRGKLQDIGSRLEIP